jgi:hypothetical protein
MENLICDLKEKLIIRKNIELDRVKKFDPEKYKDLLLISSGKIFELDQLINFLDDMLNYNRQTKKITK